MDDEHGGWEAQNVECPRCGSCAVAVYPTGLRAIECGWCGFWLSTDPDERMREAMALPKAGNA